MLSGFLYACTRHESRAGFLGTEKCSFRSLGRLSVSSARSGGGGGGGARPDRVQTSLWRLIPRPENILSPLHHGWALTDSERG